MRDVTRADYHTVYNTFNDEQRDAVGELYMSGTNHDGHTWVTYSEVEKCIARLMLAEKDKCEDDGK